MERKNCFIINTSAGKSSAMHTLAADLKEISDDFKIHRTKCAGDAATFVRHCCQSHPDEKIRFYACGGDGTLNEVVNGAVGFENAEVACYPCGIGNDFVKYYGGKGRFMDIKSLMSAEARPVDLMKANGVYSINVINAGFDAYACEAMSEVKRKPFIGGGNAYYYGVAKSLISAMQTEAFVYADGELINPDGEMLLLTAANGRYYGGSFCCAPYSLNNDGLMELCFVKPISRLKFLTLVGLYKKGEHLDSEKFEKYIYYRRCRKIEIIGRDNLAVTCDGELYCGKEFTVEIVPSALNFVVPD